MNLSQPVTDLCRPAENIVIIQCTFHINVGVQDDPSDTNGIKLTLYLDPHFKDVFLFLVVHGLSSKDKDPLLRPFSPCYLNSFKPLIPKKSWARFSCILYYSLSPWKKCFKPVGQLNVSCCFDWFSVSSDVSINSPFLFYLLHKVVEACMHCNSCGCDSFVLVLTSCKCLLPFLMVCIDLW